VVEIVAGSGKGQGTGIPGPVAGAGLGSDLHYAFAPNGDIYLCNGTPDLLKLSGGQVTVYGKLDPQGGPGSGGVAVAADGSVYVATPSTVRKFTTDGKNALAVTTTATFLSSSLGPIALDGAGILYVADGSRRVSRFGADRVAVTIAGTGKQAPPDSAAGDGGPAVKSPLGAPVQLAIAPDGSLLIADASAHRVRRVATDGTITTVAGGGTITLATGTETYAPDGTKPTDLKLASVSGVAVDAQGRIYVADAQSHAIFRFAPGGGIELVAGDQKGGSATPGLPANQTRVTNVGQLGFDPSGKLLFVESGVLRSITVS
jgi:sugar lactone lactonase YvrE